MLERYGGLLALVVILYWIFKDTGATSSVVNNLSAQNTRFFTAARGGR